MMYPNAKIIVFCKAPEAGKVKTRLAKDIGESTAATVHKNLARHCLQQLTQFNVAPVELWCAPNTRDDFFRACHTDFAVSLKQQEGDDLGQRMQHALHETLNAFSPVIIVGTDCPIFTADHFKAALSSASQNKTVIIPAEDGGYVLLAVTDIQPKLFSDMPWGSADVYKETVARHVGEIESIAQLWDVDYLQDLKRLHKGADRFQLNAEFKRCLSSLNLD